MARWFWPAASVLVLLHGAAAWMLRIPQVSPASNDEALYLLLARSLRSFHYVDAHVMGAPIHALYPPGFPGILAVTTTIFGARLDVALATNILLSMLALLLLFDFVRRFAGPEVGLLALAALVFNTKLVGFASRVYSEPAYLGVSVAALWTLSYFRAERTRLLLGGGLVILAALTRSIGVSLVVALILVWLLERRYRAVAWFGLAAALTVGAWLVWTALAPDKITERNYAAVAATVGQHSAGLAGVALRRISAFFTTYLGRSFPSALDVPTVSGVVVDNVFYILLVVGLGLAGMVAASKGPRTRILTAYALVYCGILMVYPYKLTRFVVPLAPIVLLLMLAGLALLLRRWSRPVLITAAAVITLPIAVRTAGLTLHQVRAYRACDRSHAMTSRACFSPDRLAFFAAARWSAEHLPPDARVVTIKEATFNYLTGRKVIHPDLVTKRARGDVTGYLDRAGIRYILLNEFVGGVEIARPLLPVCQRLQVTQVFSDRTALLYLPPTGAADGTAGDACALLQGIADDFRQGKGR